ncbi:MAG TPA: dual specificity protein phosphatase family protein [Blastocatellia bacterium]|jgi:protein tyrosine/serine phosphatase|nr:dual specificity protein phosphatase family protein [Blastocatellia bacterium]
MRVERKVSRGKGATTFAALAVVMMVAVQSVAQTESDWLSKIKIKNFGCVNDTLYRGAQPKSTDYAALAAIGIKTIVDLQREGDSGEQQSVEAAGMKFFRIGLSDKARPSTEKVEEFLKIVNDPVNQPVFVHCRGGRHRTGMLTAVYRMRHDGWNAERAYAEMKKFDFEYGFGHTPLKDFVYDYYSQMGEKAASASTAK